MPKKKSSSKKISGFRNFVKHFPKLSLKTKTLSLLGILFVAISLFWHLNQSIQLAFFTPKVVPIVKTHAIPTQLIIQKVDINLPIEETAINNGMWQIAENGASHLTISARPGEKGPIIIYGHNTNDRLGPIRWLSKGDSIEINTADKKSYTYIIRQTMTVSPNQMDIFTQQKGETLIIYTCDGFADLQRFVIIALPK